MDIRDFISFLNNYSMFDFYDGRKEPGMLVCRFDSSASREEYRFVPQMHMETYKDAFEKADRSTCDKVSERIDPEDVLEIRSVTFADFKRALESGVNRMFSSNL
ncbi:MAG: hypothetical protein ACKOQ6_00645 [Bacteroidota bacterium]